MGWSKSQQKPYAHSQEHQNAGSIPVELWAEKSIYSSFWDSVICLNKDKKKLMEAMEHTKGKCPIPSSIWSWKACS